MKDRLIVESIQAKFEALDPELNEHSHRSAAAIESTILGRGGIGTMSEATRLLATLSVGAFATFKAPRHSACVARSSARRWTQALYARKPKSDASLKALVEPRRGATRVAIAVDVQDVRQLAGGTARQRQPVDPTDGGSTAADAGRLQSARQRKTREGGSHPDRNAQFEYINACEAFQRRGQPVISVDTKKKEMIGDFKNGGREWRPQGEPEEVRVHDFQDPKLGKANPYGVYDLTYNEGWVSVGIDHDTAEFAAEAIRRWWQKMGQALSPGEGVADHSRWWREQQQSLPVVEGVACKAWPIGRD